MAMHVATLVQVYDCINAMAVEIGTPYFSSSYGLFLSPTDEVCNGSQHDHLNASSAFHHQVLSPIITISI
jgi:hypothetical protein